MTDSCVGPTEHSFGATSQAIQSHPMLAGEVIRNGKWNVARLFHVCMDKIRRMEGHFHAFLIVVLTRSDNSPVSSTRP